MAFKEWLGKEGKVVDEYYYREDDHLLLRHLQPNPTDFNFVYNEINNDIEWRAKAAKFDPTTKKAQLVLNSGLGYMHGRDRS